MTVLEQVLVLAVAQEASRDDTKPKVVSAVTLELSPGDAEKLDLARSVGTLSLVLRNQLDKKAVATTGVTKAELLGLKQTAGHQCAAFRPAGESGRATRCAQARSPPPRHPRASRSFAQACAHSIASDHVPMPVHEQQASRTTRRRE